ncbi:MAG: cupin domain-containing protein [Alphaproteobacteria bacterium]|nr:MAG: cupin domain-containing protein [Alphaproteobacteria bacterium]
MDDSERGPKVETYRFVDDGTVPNNSLPLVVYRGALEESGDRAAACERMFDRNGWPGAWRNGIYGHHHYHSTAHEVLGIAAGHARVRLGGERGETVELRAGDVVVIPAGVAHKRETASPDLLVIGSYPCGQSPDICRAEPRAHDKAQQRIATVPLPAADPVTGSAEPLLACWTRSS